MRNVPGRVWHISQIADEQNAESRKTLPCFKDRRWNSGQMSQRLLDPAVTGLLHFKNSHHIPGYYLSVVDQETF